MEWQSWKIPYNGIKSISFGATRALWSLSAMFLCFCSFFENGICNDNVAKSSGHNFAAGAPRELSGPGAKILFGPFGQWCPKNT